LAKEKGRQWDGKSRVSNDTYRKRFNEIFGKRTYQKKIDHSNDITFENEIKKEKTVSELLEEGFEEEQEYLKELEDKL